MNPQLVVVVAFYYSLAYLYRKYLLFIYLLLFATTQLKLSYFSEV